jgi:hypothetical protein
MSLPAHETALHSIMGTMQKESDMSQAFGDPEVAARLESTLSAATNLDDLVELLADLIGTSITIEDTAFCLLAYSHEPTPVDRARRETILRKSVPPDIVRSMQNAGVMTRVHRSHDPVHAKDPRPELDSRSQGPWSLKSPVPTSSNVAH